MNLARFRLDIGCCSGNIAILQLVSYSLKAYNNEAMLMPQISLENNDRMSLRIAAKEKSLLMRAAAIEHTNLTEFVVRTAVSSAQSVIDEHEKVALTERDSLLVLDLLDAPPEPNKKLLAAAFAMPKTR